MDAYVNYVDYCNKRCVISNLVNVYIWAPGSSHTGVELKVTTMWICENFTNAM